MQLQVGQRITLCVNGEAIDQQPELWWQAAVAAIDKLALSAIGGDDPARDADRAMHKRFRTQNQQRQTNASRNKRITQ